MNNQKPGASGTPLLFHAALFFSFVLVAFDFATDAYGGIPTRSHIEEAEQTITDSIREGLKSGTISDAIAESEKNLTACSFNQEEQVKLFSHLFDQLEKEALMPELVKSWMEAKFTLLDNRKADGFISPRELGRVEVASAFEKQLIAYIKRYSRTISRCVNDENNFEDCISQADLKVYAANMAENLKALPTSAGSHSCLVTVEGHKRSFKIHIPPSRDGSTRFPLVIVLHGACEDAQNMVDVTKFNDLADQKGFIVVYPEAEYCMANRGRTWNVGDSIFWTVDDVEFIRNLILIAENKLNVDPGKIFAAGFSNGAMLAHEIATRIPRKIAAFASVSGSMNGTEGKPENPVSALIIHGDQDEIVPAEGRRCWTGFWFFTMKSTDYAVEFWKNANEATNLLSSSTSSLVEKKTFSSADHRHAVVQIVIKGGRHSWSSDKLETTDTIWQFFQAHPKS